MKPTWSAELSFGLRFYLGLGAPAERRRYPDCRVRAARGCTPDDVCALVAAYLGRSETDLLERVNFRSGVVTRPGAAARFFVKEFPRRHRGHDLERVLRISRTERAWRAAHLLPRLGIATPQAIGTAQRRGEDGALVEYLVTEWLEHAVPFPDAVRAAAAERRAMLLREFAAQLRFWHSRAVYSRDLVKNVLVQEVEGARRYWLTDLDGIHPMRRVNDRRIAFHLRQLASYCPLSREEARIVSAAYLGGEEETQAVLSALAG